MRPNRFPLGLLAVLATTLSVGCGSGSSGSGSGSASTAAPTTSASGAATTSSATTPTTPPVVTPPVVTPPATTYAISGWLPAWARTHGDAMIDANTGRVLDEVNLFAYGINPDGTLIKARGIDDPGRIALIRGRGGEVIPTIYDVNDGNALEAVLASPTAWARLIRSITDVLDTGGYDGIDIDFEHAKSSNRDAFTRFVVDLGREVKARGKVYSVTIPGKRRDLPSWAGYDYAALGAAADRIKIMAYGYSGTWSNYPGGPICPTDWIVKVLDYAVTVIPANKIQLGIPFYGYDWADDGSRARSVTFVRSKTLVASTGATPRYDASRGETTFTYMDGTVEHTVWYSDARSVAAKAELVKTYNLRGLCIWALGYGDPEVYDALYNTLKK